MVRPGAYVDREPVSSSVVCIVVQTVVARDAPGPTTVKSQYQALIQPNLLWEIVFD